MQTIFFAAVRADLQFINGVFKLGSCFEYLRCSTREKYYVTKYTTIRDSQNCMSNWLCLNFLIFVRPYRIDSIFQSINSQLDHSNHFKRLQIKTNSLHLIDCIIQNSGELINLNILLELPNYKVLLKLLEDPMITTYTSIIVSVLSRWMKIFRNHQLNNPNDSIIRFRIDDLGKILSQLNRYKLRPPPNPKPSAPPTPDYQESFNRFELPTVEHTRLLTGPSTCGVNQQSPRRQLTNNCYICHKNEKNYACIPCGHKIICAECFKQSRDAGLIQCAICNRQIVNYIRVFD